MKERITEIIKDLIISLLIVACIGIILSMIFYDKIAIGKVIPEAENYTLSAEMRKELENSKLNDAEEVIVNYYIDASDLKKYEKTNEYIKGKSNPFAAVSDLEIENNTSSNVNQNTGTGGFYEDDGTK